MFKFFSKSKLADSSASKPSKISTAISQIFTHKKLNEEVLEELEETLIINDIGSEVAISIVDELRSQKFAKDISEDEIKSFLANELEKVIKPCEKTLEFKEDAKPQVIIFNGVNGAGKTTTIGKVASKLKLENKKVLIAACDTFRAAAADQLEVWAKRSGCEIIMPKKEAEDPAAVAYRALDYAKQKDFDVLLVDTAGRLQNKQNLMDELKKISSVLKKIDETAPHENILILDGTVGQNAINQLETFNNIVGITGLVVTKLDGTSKGGILVALAKKFQKPIYAIGVGEKLEDLQEFDAQSFARNLVGI